MPLQLKKRSTTPLPPFTFELISPSPPTDLGLPINQNEPIPPIPPASFIPEKDMYMYGTYPLSGDGEVGRGIIRCKRCGKVGMEWAAGEHRRICNHVIDGTPLTTKKVNTKSSNSKPTEMSKKRRASEVSNPNLSPKKRTKLSTIPNPNSSTNSISGNGNGSSKSSSKDILLEKENEDQDNDDDDEDDDMIDGDIGDGNSIDNLLNYKGIKKDEMRRKQKEKERIERKEAKERTKSEIAERKRMKATNPINLDRQCGVINDKSTPCARSLTCKTHTVGAKRAVQGRSRAYDELYLEWQREHNPNFKEPQKKELKDPSLSSSLLSKNKSSILLKKKKKLNNSTNRFKGGIGGEEYLDIDDEDGLKELQDLIGLTKLSAEKVKNNYYTLGSWGNDTTSQGGLPGLPLNGTSTSKLSNGNNRPSIIGSSGKQNSNSKLPSSTTLMNNTNTVIPFQSIWKSNSVEFNSVGQLLTKALAARPNRDHGHGHGKGGGGAGGGNQQKRNSILGSNKGQNQNNLNGLEVTA